MASGPDVVMRRFRVDERAQRRGEISAICLNLAKFVFQVRVVDAVGLVVLHIQLAVDVPQRANRRRLIAWVLAKFSRTAGTTGNQSGVTTFPSRYCFVRRTDLADLGVRTHNKGVGE